jgi:hypothetical protein
MQEDTFSSSSLSARHGASPETEKVYLVPVENGYSE